MDSELREEPKENIKSRTGLSYCQETTKKNWQRHLHVEQESSFMHFLHEVYFDKIYFVLDKYFLKLY